MGARTDLITGAIRDIADFPKPGILFRDITPLLATPEAFKAANELLVERYQARSPTAVVAIESRGFIFGAPLALSLGVPLHVVRKPGKLPWKTDFVEYSLEYGTDRLEMHQDSLTAKDQVVVVDDLLATGGTAAATCELVAKQGAKVLECAFLIELADLAGKDKVAPVPCHALVTY